MTKGKNRVLCLILTAIMLLSMSSVSVLAYEDEMYSDAELRDYSQELAIFRGIGLFDVNRDVHAIVTRAEFVSMFNSFFGHTNLAKMLGQKGLFSDVNSENAAEIEFAVNNGYISAETNGKFNPDGGITLNTAMESLVAGLGYKYVAEKEFQGNDAYLAMARKLKLFDDVAIKDERYPLTYGEVLVLFKNALSVDLMFWNHTSEGTSFYIATDNTVMSEIHKCTEYKGIVTATSLSDLYGGEAAAEGFVKIDEKAYAYDVDTNALLGKAVKYFIKQVGSESKLVYVCEDYDRNSELIINSDNLQSYESRVYKYYDENDKTETITLKSGCSIIYNGRSNSSALISESFDMLPQDGSIRFLDNNKDRVYDVVFIEDYDTFVAGTVDSTAMTVYDANDNTRRFNFSNLSEKGKLILTSETGKNVEFKVVKAGSIISVAMSADGEYCRVVVCNTKVKGVVTGVGEDEIKLDGVTYKVNLNTIPTVTARPGETITAYTDLNGKIANYEITPRDAEVVYLINADIITEALTRDLKMRVCNSSGGVEVLLCADNVYVNDVRKDIADVLAILKAGEASVKPGLITIARNTEGLVNRIYTIHTGTAETCPEEAIMQNTKLEANYKYMSSTRSFRDFKTVLSSTCKVFLIPENPQTADDEEFSVGSPTVFENDKAYKVTTYITGGKGLLSTYAVADSTLRASTSLYIVNSVSKEMNSDGEVYTSIRGFFGSASEGELCIYDNAVDVESVPAHSTTVSGQRFSVTPGDVIHYNRKTEGGKSKVTGIQMLYDIESGMYLGRNPQNADANAGGNWYMGDVWIMDSGYAGIVMNGGQELISQTPIGPSFDPITAENYRLERVSAGTIYRFEKGRVNSQILAGKPYTDIVDYQTSKNNYSRVFVYTNAGNTHTCYIVN